MVALSQSYINDAALRISAFIKARIGHQLTITVPDVLNVCSRLSVKHAGWVDGQDFKAAMCELPNGTFGIGYNKAYSDPVQCRHIIHELAEYLATQDLPGLFDDTEDAAPIRYDGNCALRDVRHLAAREAERLLGLQYNLPPSPEKHLPPKHLPDESYKYSLEFRPSIPIERIPNVDDILDTPEREAL